jgi:hypothetical protein
MKKISRIEIELKMLLTSASTAAKEGIEMIEIETIKTTIIWSLTKIRRVFGLTRFVVLFSPLGIC